LAMTLLTAVIVSVAVSASAGASTAPRKPTVKGLRTTTVTRPTYRFSSSATGVPAARILFRCSIDSPKLQSCPAVFKPKLKLKIGKHVLRVRAVAPGGATSGVTIVRIEITYKAGCSGLPTGGKELIVRSPDGARLYGIRFGKGHVGVALAPQLGGDTCDWAPMVKPLLSKGLQVLIYEAGDGLNLSDPPPGLLKRDVELAAMGNSLRSNGVDTLFIGGSSMGGTAAIEAISLLNPAPRGVVALAAASFSPTALANLEAQSSVSLLFMAGSIDPVALDLSNAYGLSVSSDKELVLYVGVSLHGVELFGSDSPVRNKAEAKIADWIAARSG